jgi:hypothetical protein
MQIETSKTRHIVLTDARNISELRRYLNAEKNSVVKPVKRLWNKQRELVTVELAEQALKIGNVPAELKDPWNEMIREFVRDDLIPEWTLTMSHSGERIAAKVNRIQRKQFEFDPTSWSAKKWVDTEGAALIVNLTAAQYKSTQALIQNQVYQGITSPYILAQRIKYFVGLTEREALAVARFMSSLTEEGITASAINTQVENYASFLHKNRAMRIARTELSNAYNFGQHDSLKQATAEGWLPGEPEKTWMAGGANPCEICETNESDGPIPLEAQFSSGHNHPTAHPNCECSVGYSVRR